MLSKSFTFIALSLSLLAKVNGHAVVSPALGVAGAPVRNDAQRTALRPCGRMNVAQNLDSSETITPAADGSITMTINNFNPGLDGSRSIRKAKLDTTGTGNFDTDVTVTKNGTPRAPTKTGNEQITVQMPAGVKCTGGATGDLCVMSFTTLSGFGNCVVVKQGAATGTGTATDTTGTAGTGTATGTGTEAGTGTGTGTGNTSTTGTGTGTGTTGTTGTGTETGTTGTGTETGTGSTDTTGTTGTGATGQTGQTGQTSQTGQTGQTGQTTGQTNQNGQIGQTGTTAGTTGTQAGAINNGASGQRGQAGAAAIGGSRAPRALIHGFLDVQ